MGRNTALLNEIVTVLDSELDDAGYALDRLEGHFHHRLLVDVGNTRTVATMATQLRLSIIEEECSRVLDDHGRPRRTGRLGVVRQPVH